MRICFIADSSSLHVKRIVSYYLRYQDQILVLSTASQLSNIPGVKTVYLLNVKKPFPTVFHTKEGQKKKSIAYLKLLIPQFLKVRVKHTWRDLYLLRKRVFCMAEIDKFNPEVIYSFRSFPEGMLASYCHIRPLLMRTAGPDISKLPRYPLYRQLIRRSLRAADVLVTESLWEREMLRDLCGDQVSPEVSIIGVDTNLFRPPASRERLRDKYNLPHDAFVVVSNRYLGGHYNGWLVVKAIESLIERCPRLILLYVTPSKMDLRSKAKIEAVTVRFPRIRFLDGPLPHAEMPDILGCGDVYISFASFDGVPNSLLEAMACGLVPIVAELPQLGEWVEENITGYFVPQHDVKKLSSTLSDLYKNAQFLPSISQRCVSKIRECGSYGQASERTRNLLKELARDKKRYRE
jgi:glycosyltransferase involved in cell wall biosynthesis